MEMTKAAALTAAFFFFGASAEFTDVAENA